MIIISYGRTHSLAIPFLLCCSDGHDMLVPFQKVCFLAFILTTSKAHPLAIFSLDGEFIFLLLCTLLKIDALAILLQKVSQPGF